MSRDSFHTSLVFPCRYVSMKYARFTNEHHISTTLSWNICNCTLASILEFKDIPISNLRVSFVGNKPVLTVLSSRPSFPFFLFRFGYCFFPGFCKHQARQLIKTEYLFVDLDLSFVTILLLQAFSIIGECILIVRSAD